MVVLYQVVKVTEADTISHRSAVIAGDTIAICLWYKEKSPNKDGMSAPANV